MKLTLTLDEVSACAMALLSKAQEAEEEALGCEKLRLLADIRMDLMVCELEGWDKLEYLDELLALVQELRKGGVGRWIKKDL